MRADAHRVSQLKPGDRGFVRPVEASKGRKRQRKDSNEFSSPATFKVMHAEALVGMLLAMGSGASSAPKGGLTGMMNAALRGELQPEVSGKFGERAYKDEPWSIVALRKRIYAVRAFYAFHLQGEQGGLDRNPGWNQTVVGTLNSFALLLGTKAQHVPRVRARFEHALRGRVPLCVCVS